MLMIVGQVQNAAEADEIELITRNFIVANRMKKLARSLREC
jgi:hypothetical protein